MCGHIMSKHLEADSNWHGHGILVQKEIQKYSSEWQFGQQWSFTTDRQKAKFIKYNFPWYGHMVSKFSEPFEPRWVCT